MNIMLSSEVQFFFRRHFASGTLWWAQVHGLILIITCFGTAYTQIAIPLSLYKHFRNCRKRLFTMREEREFQIKMIDKRENIKSIYNMFVANISHFASYTFSFSSVSILPAIKKGFYFKTGFYAMNA